LIYWLYKNRKPISSFIKPGVATIHFVRISPNTLGKSDQVITIYASTICASQVFASFKCMTLKKTKKILEKRVCNEE
jgi:hypothetical protein